MIRKKSADKIPASYSYGGEYIGHDGLRSVSLVVIAVWIGWEAISRLRHPERGGGVLMIGVAAAAMVLNVVIGLGLHRGSKQDMNVRSAYLHMVGDAVSALGVIIAGVLVATTGTPLADPVVLLLIVALILYCSYGVLRESDTVLLEGTPAGMNMPALIAASRGSAVYSMCTI